MGTRLRWKEQLRITHIGPDSEFVRFASEIFESVAPGTNEYIILTGSDNRSVRFPPRRGRIRVVSSGIRGTAPVPFAVRGSDIIIAHSMSPHAALAFATARPRTLKVWSGWGFDYYGSDDSPDFGLLGHSTLQLSSALGSSIGDLNVIKALRRKISRSVIRQITHHAAAKTDYFSAIPDDLKVFTTRFPEFHGSYAQLNYSSVTGTFARGAIANSGSDILVGNSASLTNNHLEVFDMLARQDLTGRRVVVPLSYGNPAYRDAIVARGTVLFGSAFLPLLEMLPLDQYISVVASCNVVIMNHQRQQALGNIGAALYHGSHVFLDKANPTLEFFRSRGAVIYDTAQLDNGLPNGPTSPETISTNRSVLEAFFGQEQITKNVEVLIGKLNPSRPEC